MSTTASRHSSESAFFQLLLTVHCLHCDLHHLAAQNLPRSRPIVLAVRYACCTHSWPLLYCYVDDGQCILSITASPKAHSSNLRTQHVVTSRHAFQFESSMQWRGGTVWTFLIFFFMQCLSRSSSVVPAGVGVKGLLGWCDNARCQELHQ